MSFFSKPQEFSFKDTLAIAFSGYFLYCANEAARGSLTAMDVIKTMVPLISIILAGYFGQEAIQLWQQKYSSKTIAPEPLDKEVV